MNNLKKIISEFQNKKIVVIGDIMLDRYLEGGVSRINPEAPVPIVSLNDEYHVLGGAANAASNIASLGGKVTLFGFVGKDKSANDIKKLLNEKNINHFLDENGSTIEKTRVLGMGQQLLRLDKEEKSQKFFNAVTKEALSRELKDASIIFISDYAKGTITADLMELLEGYKDKMIIDPKPENKNLYKGAFLITPNEKESREMSFCSNVEKSGQKLKQELNSNILIKRAEKGVSLFSDRTMNIPTYAKEVYDVSGAGDTFVASLSLSIASGASLEEATIIANHAAGISVEKMGTYSVTLNELRERITQGDGKIHSFDQIVDKVLDKKRKGSRIVWTNGCFDLLHIGHVKYLKEAKKLGDILVVGLNSDESIKSLKGPDRPIQTETERAEIVSSLEFVDFIFIFPEERVSDYLRTLKPDFYTKGGDYNLDTIDADEKEAVESYGGNIRFIKLVNGKSSTNIINKISDTQTYKKIQ